MVCPTKTTATAGITEKRPSDYVDPAAKGLLTLDKVLKTRCLVHGNMLRVRKLLGEPEEQSNEEQQRQNLDA